jgi:hypothetical protein
LSQSGIGTPYQWLLQVLSSWIHVVTALQGPTPPKKVQTMLSYCVLVLLKITEMVVMSRDINSWLSKPFTHFICRRRCLQPMHSWHILYSARFVGSVSFGSTVVQRPWLSLNKNDWIEGLGCFLHGLVIWNVAALPHFQWKDVHFELCISTFCNALARFNLELSFWRLRTECPSHLSFSYLDLQEPSLLGYAGPVIQGPTLTTRVYGYRGQCMLTF